MAPADEAPQAAPAEHWSFRPLSRPTIPAVQDMSWVRNPIDAFIASERERRGLVPSPPASRSRLLRRIYLDLVGVPPTRDELHAFLSDSSSDAYEKVVDRLLASPQYGERWGRHWMDVWRYSDWYGRRRVPDVLNSYAQIWRWRDWIVRSLNEDKGYDRMVMEMLAADEIAPGDDANVVATGFIIRNFYRWNYNTWMKDQIEHTGKAFLGLTLNCCHCHDHKYDPITNDEYFRFRAFFEPIEVRHDRVPGEPDPGVYPKYEYGKPYKPIQSGMVRIMDEKLDAETFAYTGGEARNVIPGRPPVQPGGPAILGGDKLVVEPIDLPPEVWYPGLRPFVQQEEVARRQAELTRAKTTLQESEARLAAAESATEVEAARLTLQVDRANVVRAESELHAIQARIAADRVRYHGLAGDAEDSSRQAAEAERQVAVETARLSGAQADRALAEALRKSADDPQRAKAVQQAEQQRATADRALNTAEQALQSSSTEYTPLSPQYPKQSTGRRAALARWIVNPTNPLTPRVAVNHIWLRHFGRALVETTENFGLNGSSPTHPKLLDWLAVELIQQQPAKETTAARPDDTGLWRMKRLHRLVVTSNTYRMKSGTDGLEHPNYAEDRDNEFLWRFQPSRMEAEVVRDSILHTAGNLDRSIGGKEIDQNEGLTTPRRSIYFEHHGEGRMQMLELFDAANPVDCYRRSSSVRPQQALAMANSELAIRQSRWLARRLGQQICRERKAESIRGRGVPAEMDHGTERFVVAAFERVLTREPTERELAASLDFLLEQVDLFRDRSVELVETAPKKEKSPPTAATMATAGSGSKSNPIPPSQDPTIRARENLIQALFSHSDFVTIR